MLVFRGGGGGSVHIDKSPFGQSVKSKNESFSIVKLDLIVILPFSYIWPGKQSFHKYVIYIKTMILMLYGETSICIERVNKNSSIKYESFINFFTKMRNYFRRLQYEHIILVQEGGCNKTRSDSYC